MTFYVKAYDFLVQILRMLFSVAFWVCVLILILNVTPDTNFIYQLLRQYIFICLGLVGLLLVTFWRPLMPTLRMYFGYKASASDTLLEAIKGNKRFISFFLIAAGLLIFAAYGHSSIFSQFYNHPVRYGYVGDLILCLWLLAMVAKIFGPLPARIETSGFVQDRPNKNLKLSDPQQVSLHYLSVVLERGLPTSVALTGDWGSGKTAVYIQAQELVNSKRSDIVWVVFDPWRYASEEALIKGFYESVAKELDRQIPGLQNALRKVARTLDQFISKSEANSILKNFSTMAKAAAKSTGSPDEVVKELLEREGKRLIIVIDDIERHYEKNRTYRALQLVHHAKNLGTNNVQLLCIFEKSAILKAAPEHVGPPQEYLEKFSELEIDITPPEQTVLRQHLDGLIQDPEYSTKLPSDFKLEPRSSIVKDLKSHRAINRAFNELLMEFASAETRATFLDMQEYGEEDVKQVAYNDRFALAHIKLKYPTIYRDIAVNRDIYTQVRGTERSIRQMFMDSEGILQEQREHFKIIFEAEKLNPEKERDVKSILVDLFPTLDNVFFPGNKNVQTDELLRERRVGHRIVLDAYFAYAKTQASYSAHERWIKELLKDIESATDDVLIERFSAYMQRARLDTSEVDSATLLRNELLRPEHKEVQLRAFRAWLRALLSASTMVREENSVLGRVLSAISSIVRQKSTPEERIALGQMIFEHITDYLSEPRGALLMLLYLAPPRGNDYLSDYMSAKALTKRGLFVRVLNWVDRYFEENQINPFEAYDYEDWAFITYQWALSIRVDENSDTEVPGAAKRFKRVNNYLFSILYRDDVLAYKVIEKRFWSNGGWESEEYRWRIKATDPFDIWRLIELADFLKTSSKLDRLQKKRMKDFERILLKHIKAPTNGIVDS